MRYSIFTPTHDARYLAFAYEGLLEQTDPDWEWLILANNGCELPELPDPRVRVVRYDHANVGALKWHACQQCSGEWLVELDHDDRLLPTALEEIGRSEADFVYSNCVQVDMDWNVILWGDMYGWEWRPVTLMGHDLKEAVSPEPWPSNLSRIWFAPNHVRAWKRDFYMRIGGHNEAMHIGDDHDLVARSYLNGTVEHIDKPLYLYRVHGENTWLRTSMEIQTTMWENHDRYFVPMVERWCELENLPKVDLGWHNAPDGYETWDKRSEADVVCDLETVWPAQDSSVGLIRAFETLEHLSDPVHAMNEAYRVLVHGGVLDVLVPSTSGEGAFCDPTHKSFWNKRSFRYYTEQLMRNYIEPECVCRFQIVKLDEPTLYENVPYVRAQLTAVKDGPRIHGKLDI